ncbi:MAG: hypothetical protein P4L46_19680 [Fimbriimonas sp.]|nr:hypothetical protein [Fimbriimonas sp.]
MKPLRPNQDNTEAMGYVKSLRDPVKRKYAADYLKWIRAGRVAAAPSRGSLSPTLWKAVCSNLDGLA